MEMDRIGKQNLIWTKFSWHLDPEVHTFWELKITGSSAPLWSYLEELLDPEHVQHQEFILYMLSSPQHQHVCMKSYCQQCHSLTIWMTNLLSPCLPQLGRKWGLQCTRNFNTMQIWQDAVSNFDFRGSINFFWLHNTMVVCSSIFLAPANLFLAFITYSYNYLNINFLVTVLSIHPLKWIHSSVLKTLVPSWVMSDFFPALTGFWTQSLMVSFVKRCWDIKNNRLPHNLFLLMLVLESTCCL